MSGAPPPPAVSKTHFMGGGGVFGTLGGGLGHGGTRHRGSAGGKLQGGGGELRMFLSVFFFCAPQDFLAN